MDASRKCVICKEYSGNGISILSGFICSECEKTLVNMNINDDRYDSYKDMIKEIILKGTILGQGAR
jgi:hypothetical protein